VAGDGSTVDEVEGTRVDLTEILYQAH
jgi:hypothetical protein